MAHTPTDKNSIVTGEVTPATVANPLPLPELAEAAPPHEAVLSELAQSVDAASLEQAENIDATEAAALAAGVSIAAVDGGAIAGPELIASKDVAYSAPLPVIGYHNRLIDGASLTTGDTSDGLNGVLTYDTSRRYTSTSGSFNLLILPVAAGVCDYIGLAGLNLDQTNGTLTVAISFGVDTPFTVVADGLTGDGRSTARLITFPPQTVAAIRLSFTGVSGHTIANISAGLSLTMQRAQYSGVTPASLSSTTKHTSAISDSGQFLNRDIMRKGVQYSAAFRHITDEWYREYFEPFTRHAETLPFYYSWNQTEDPSGAIYGVSKSDIVPSKMGIRDWLEVSFDIVGHR